MNGKMPMFAKVSLISFAYNVIYTFGFPNDHVKNTLSKNDIDFLFSYVKFTVWLMKCNGESNFFKF